MDGIDPGGGGGGLGTKPKLGNGNGSSGLSIYFLDGWVDSLGNWLITSTWIGSNDGAFGGSGDLGYSYESNYSYSFFLYSLSIFYNLS